MGDEGFTILIPSYREQNRLPSTLREIQIFQQKHGLVKEVLIVDDGSRDATVERAMMFSDVLPMKFIRLAKNTGKWAAIWVGLRAALCDDVVLLDADGSASIWEVEMLGEETFGMHVFGSRFMVGATVDGKSLLRKIISLGYREYVKAAYWFATGRSDIDDMQCPFKLLRRDLLVIPPFPVSSRFAGDIELACCLRGEVVNVPVQFIHKRGGVVRGGTVWRMAVETLRVAWAYRGLRKSKGINSSA